MAINIMIQFNGKQLTLPINPERLKINQSASNEDIEIIGIGQTTRKGSPELQKISIEGFFPAVDSYYYTGVSPKTCIEFINTIWNTDNTNNNVARIITTELPINLNMLFVIENFNPEIRAGEEGDVYYTLDIKEYKPYGVKIVEVQKSGLEATRAASTTQSNTASDSNNTAVAQTYTVQSGDCLWNITKACCGDGSRWKELYNLNTAVIGNNPNLIKPGQVLTLPNGWASPTNVQKLTNVSTATRSTSSASTSTSQNTPTTSSTHTESNQPVIPFKEIIKAEPTNTTPTLGEKLRMIIRKD